MGKTNFGNPDFDFTTISVFKRIRIKFKTANSTASVLKKTFKYIFVTKKPSNICQFLMNIHCTVLLLNC